MKRLFWGFRDFWGRYTIDRAGREQGIYTAPDLRVLLDTGQVGPKTWLRHVVTERYNLVGEVLYNNDLASDEEFEQWFPKPQEKLRNGGLQRMVN